MRNDAVVADAQADGSSVLNICSFFLSNVKLYIVPLINTADVTHNIECIFRGCLINEMIS